MSRWRPGELPRRRHSVGPRSVRTTTCSQNCAHYDFFVTRGHARAPHAPTRFGSAATGPIRARRSASATTRRWRSRGRRQRREVRRGPARARGCARADRRYRYEVTTTFLGLTGAGLAHAAVHGRGAAAGAGAGPAARRVPRPVPPSAGQPRLPHRHQVRPGRASSRRTAATRGPGGARARRIRCVVGAASPEHIPLWRLFRLAPLLAARVRIGTVIEKALRDICDEALDPEAQVTMRAVRGRLGPARPRAAHDAGHPNSVLGTMRCSGWSATTAPAGGRGDRPAARELPPFPGRRRHVPARQGAARADAPRADRLRAGSGARRARAAPVPARRVGGPARRRRLLAVLARRGRQKDPPARPHPSPQLAPRRPIGSTGLAIKPQR